MSKSCDSRADWSRTVVSLVDASKRPHNCTPRLQKAIRFSLGELPAESPPACWIPGACGAVQKPGGCPSLVLEEVAFGNGSGSLMKFLCREQLGIAGNPLVEQLQSNCWLGGRPVQVIHSRQNQRPTLPGEQIPHATVNLEKESEQCLFLLLAPASLAMANSSHHPPAAPEAEWLCRPRVCLRCATASAKLEGIPEGSISVSVSRAARKIRISFWLKARTK